MSESETMKNEPVIFNSISIEHFRGFNSAIKIPLDASAVIVSGANGRGKTSLFDAIQWLILGNIERLKELNYRKEEHIINIYSPTGSKAKVTCEIRLNSSDKPVSMSRTGDSNNSLLEVNIDGDTIIGEKAEIWLRKQLGKSELEADLFNREFLSAGLLQQDVVREFLSAKPAERHQILSRMLGISEISEFINKLEESTKLLNAWIKDIRNDLNKSRLQLEQLQLQEKEIITRIEAAPVITKIKEKVIEKLQKVGLSFLLKDYEENLDTDLKPFSIHLRSCRQLFTKLDELMELSSLHFQNRPSAVLDDLLDLCSGLEEQTKSHQKLLEDDQNMEVKLLLILKDARAKTDNLRQLASLAIPLLSESCPVCKQKIDLEHVKKYLESMTADQPDLLEAEQAYTKIIERISAKERKIAQLKIALNNAINDKESIEQWYARANTFISDIANIKQSLCEIGYEIPVREIDTSGNWIPQLISWVKDNLAHLYSLENTMETGLAAQSLSAEHSKLERLKQESSHVEEQLAQKESTLEKTNRASYARKSLLQVAKEKEIEVVEEMFHELGPVVQDLFSRLAPHPTFRQLSISHELYYGKGTSIPRAIDPLYGYEVNPSIIFSSAQANVAAICYFIALAFSSSTTDFGFILLDDPLQSMDDINVLGLSDLCRFLRREKQLIVATHEDRLSSLLLRKLTSRDEPFQTLKLDFRAWNSQGPVIKEERIEITPTEAILADVN